MVCKIKDEKEREWGMMEKRKAGKLEEKLNKMEEKEDRMEGKENFEEYES